ncbi:hypothetical protein LDENG_00283390 [Lucifuga dentata]|nr:hypothetical protein LDENG_00283390 [Lucifuga dentata]
MNIHHTLVCVCLLFFTGHTGLFADRVLRGAVGGNITAECSFKWAKNNRKLFCRNTCDGNNLLIQTNKDVDQNGRFIIEDKRTGSFRITITRLKKSDSGWYRCGVERSVVNSYDDFEIDVSDAPTMRKPEWTPPTPTAQSSSSAPGSTRPSDPPETAKDLQDKPLGQTKPTGVLLYLGVALAVLVLVFGLSMLILCRKRITKPAELPVDEDEAADTEVDGVYKVRGHSAPISTVYANAKYTKPQVSPLRNTEFSLNQLLPETSS